MRRGYMPPGDTPNLKYWERNRIRHYRPITRLGLRLLKAESEEGDPRYKQLVQSVGTMTTDIEMFNHWNNNRGQSPWVTEENPDGQTFFIGLDKSHISYIVHGGVYIDVFDHPKFQRLSDISNLGVTRIEIPCASHKRSEHSLLAGIMVEHILRNNGFSERYVNLGILSALLHDLAMPPYSDYGKLACPEELDEEKNIEIVLGDGSFDHIFDRYGTSRQEVIDTIRGKGVIGQLINSKGVDMDKVSYTGVDLSRTYGADPWGRMRVAKRDSFLFDIYEDVVIDGSSVVFSNPQRLFRFLYVRALLFEKVHFASTNRARETYLRGVLQKLWKNGKITKELMLTSNDYWFLDSLHEELGDDFHEFHTFSFPVVEIGRYKTIEEARKAHEGEDVLIDQWRTFNPATRTLTLEGGKKENGKIIGGKIVPFREGYPEQAEIIEKISREQEYVGVYRREEATHSDLELLHHVRKRAEAETMGVPRKILKDADIETPERIIWALEQTGRKEEAIKMLKRLSAQDV